MITLIVNYNSWFADDDYCEYMCTCALALNVDRIVTRDPRRPSQLVILAVNDGVEIAQEIVGTLCCAIQEELRKQ